MPGIIYADHNATTPLNSGAMARLEEAMRLWGNPSSAHAVGRKGREFMEESRRLVAGRLGVEPTEVVFTSGGSEANTLALWGAVLANPELRLVVSTVEHSSVIDTARLLESKGTAVAWAPVTGSGELDLPAFCELLDSFKPHLVSVMAANNETGVIFPIPELAKLCRERGILLHTDAVQAFGKLPVSHWAGADFVSVSAHKIGGPKGAGALVVRKGRKLVSTHYGGSQEIKRRGGTENTLGIAGFAGACAQLPAFAEPPLERFERGIKAGLTDFLIAGEAAPRLPTTTNVRFLGIPAEVLLSAFDLEGLCVSAGSACSSGSISPSHVLLAMGLSTQEAREGLRFSWGPSTTTAEIDTAVSLVIEHVNRIRSRRKQKESLVSVTANA